MAKTKPLAIERPAKVEATVPLSVKIPVSLAGELDLFMEYLEASKGYVVEKALALAMSVDDKFAAWKAQRPPAEQPKPAVVEPKPEAGKQRIA